MGWMILSPPMLQVETEAQKAVCSLLASQQQHTTILAYTQQDLDCTGELGNILYTIKHYATFMAN